MRRATKNDIIHVNLNKYKIIVIFKSKDGLVYALYHIPQESFKPSIRCPQHLLKPV
jgi:hypothetical protein